MAHIGKGFGTLAEHRARVALRKRQVELSRELVALGMVFWNAVTREEVSDVLKCLEAIRAELVSLEPKFLDLG